MKATTLCLAFMLAVSSLAFSQTQYRATVTRSDSSSCGPNLTVNFTATVTSGIPVSYEWRFGDGTISNVQNPTHTYTLSGSGRFYPFVRITFSGGAVRNFSFTNRGPIKIGPPEISSLRARGDACGPGDHDFSASLNAGLVSANRLSYEWEVNGPSGTSFTSNQPDPSFHLPQLGSYTAKLKAWLDPACPDSQTTTFDVDTVAFHPTITDASCGSNNGMISVSPKYGSFSFPPFGIGWSTGDSTNSINNLAPGTYSASVYYYSSNYQCIGTDSFEVKMTGSLDYTIMPTSVACEQDSNGSIDITILSNSGPVTYLWSTGETTQDISNLPAGTYSVAISDNNCTFNETVVIEGSIIDAAFTSVDANCSGNAGSLEVVASGGQAPYSYLWSNGVATSLNSNIPVGGYSVVITDATGCADREVAFVEVEDSCFYTLSGKVYYDYNGNCVFDGNDVYLTRGWISLDNGASFDHVDNQGNYSFDVPSGPHSLEVSGRSLTFASVTCPSTASYNPTVSFSDINGLDFALQPSTTSTDLAICITNNAIRPGFFHRYGVHITNFGATPMSGIVTFTHAPLVTLPNPPANYDPTTRTVSWTYNNLLPGRRRSFSLTGRIDPTVAIGTTINSFAEVGPIANDIFPMNNDFHKRSLVVGSYDPNDKQVDPPGESSQGLIESSENLMLYTIRFQNTGNFSAEFVVLRDTLDASLDPEYLKPVAASHNYTMTMEGNALEVRFDNINLPDSTSDPEGSQGFFAFYIRHDGVLLPNTEIKNTAAIYFDFNAPIITNTVLNTIAEPSSIFDPGEDLISVYPNPSHGLFFINEVGGQLEKVSVYDLGGKLIYQGNDMRIDLSDQVSGIYMLHIQTSEGVHVQKISLER